MHSCWSLEDRREEREREREREGRGEEEGKGGDIVKEYVATGIYIIYISYICTIMNLSLLDLRFFFKYPRDKRKDESCSPAYRSFVVAPSKDT